MSPPSAQARALWHRIGPASEDNALAIVLGTAALAAQVFRGGADVVLLNVTVTDGEGHFVSHLDKTDFQVFEDGVRQEIGNFSRDPQPIALSILLDTSTSMERKLPIAQEAAAGFVRRLGAKDVAQVISFDTRADIRQDFTNDRAALEKAIRRTQAGGSTALYIAVYAALDALKGAVAQSADAIRRQSIIVLSDGEDTSSLIDYDQVMDAAKRSEVSIYTIALRSKEDAPPHGFNEADFVLRTMAQETGGRVYHVDDVAQLPGIYQQIADELANQYTIGYTSKNAKRDGAVAPGHGESRPAGDERAHQERLFRAGSRPVTPTGRVCIIGAGPGDPGLITARGLRLLQEADVVVYDRAVDALLRWARPEAERLEVGAPAERDTAQDAISMLLAEKARDGQMVARLKWGDAFVFDSGAKGGAVSARTGNSVRSRARHSGRRRRDRVRGHSRDISGRGRRGRPAPRARIGNGCRCPTWTGTPSPASTAPSSATSAAG